jgi:hypothetical protein
MSQPVRVSCASHVDRATVHARGAVVTRAVRLPADLPSGACVLDVRLGWCALEPSSLRALVTGARAVLAVDVRVIDPRAAVDRGPIEAEVERCAVELSELQQQAERIDERMSSLAAVRPDPGLRPRKPGQDGPGRLRDALAASALLDGLWSELHAERTRLDPRLRELERALAAARLRLAQSSSATEGAVDKGLRISVQLAAARDGAGLDALELEYVVPAARWWPAYKVRLSDGARRARWSLDAFIAQMSGEDWLDAKVSLSTADLVRDVRLPTLPSLRLGRVQPGKRAFREAPRGVDALFAGYDDALRAASHASRDPSERLVTRAGAVPPAMSRGAQAARPTPSAPTLGARARSREESDGMEGSVELEDFDDDAASPSAMEATASMTMAPALAEEPSPELMPPMAPRSMSLGMVAMGDGLRAMAPSVSRAGATGGAAGGSASPPTRKGFQAAGEGLDPDEAWMDFDGLALEDPAKSLRRGRLVRSELDWMGVATRGSCAVLERVPTPADAADPLEARGQFDCCFEGTARVDVRSDGRAHRVSVAEAEGTAAPRWRTVPRESAEVFREAEVHNPFDAPLLGGPAEVFFEDALLARTTVAAVDRGGMVSLGLGVEERIRVARNGRAQESTVGLLGGSTQVDHHVTIELASALGEAVTVEVIDRVPFAKKDDEVEVIVVASKPTALKYAQTERRAPVEGGLLWRVELGPGARSAVEFQYRIVFSSKLELQGGNRRE